MVPVTQKAGGEGGHRFGREQQNVQVQALSPIGDGRSQNDIRDGGRVGRRHREDSDPPDVEAEKIALVARFIRAVGHANDNAGAVVGSSLGGSSAKKEIQRLPAGGGRKVNVHDRRGPEALIFPERAAD